MSPSSEPVASVRPRLPDWVFALGVVGSIILLIRALVWAPEGAQFAEPLATIESETAAVGIGGYTALADVHPGEEPPPVETIAVEEFGYEIDADGEEVSWGASIRNAHSEYAADFELRVTIDGINLAQSEEYSSSWSAQVLPGGQVLTGDAVGFDEALPADTTVEIEVIRLEWFAFDGGTPPEAQETPLSSRVDAVDAPADERRSTFSVTFTNTSAYAIDPYLTAIFRRPDGSPVGGSYVLPLLALPPGDSTREIELRDTRIPAGADLSLTEFVPTW